MINKLGKIIAAFMLITANSSFALEVEIADNGKPFISHEGKPAFGYGPSPQKILTYLPSGEGNDYRKWLTWAQKYHMNHVRSYPPSTIVEQPALNLFERANNDATKFDLNQFNKAYFDELRNASRLMKEKGFFIHLQLWQVVSWKKNWRNSYYNPTNNINPDISENAGPGKFMVLSNPILLAHQKNYVRKILDTTADLGNVYYDIANEIGNGTASNLLWVKEMLSTMRQWEKENSHKLLVTINDEGGRRVEGIENIYKDLDLIIKDLGRWDEHTETQKQFRKPTISVRNIDWDYDNEKRHYFFGSDNLEVNEDNSLQIRGRKYWWRMFMAKVQMAGAYADAYDKTNPIPGSWLIEEALARLGFNITLGAKKIASYDLNHQSENNFVPFRLFIDQIVDYPSLTPTEDIVKGHPAKHSYCLQSSKEIVIYLESPNGKAGYSYPASNISLSNLMISDGQYQGYFYNPESGDKESFILKVQNGNTSFATPAFNDDLAIYIY